MADEPKLPFSEARVLEMVRAGLATHSAKTGDRRVALDVPLRIGACTVLRRKADRRAVTYSVTVMVDPKLGVPRDSPNAEAQWGSSSVFYLTLDEDGEPLEREEIIASPGPTCRTKATAVRESFERFTEGAKRALFASRSNAFRAGSLSIEGPHLLHALLSAEDPAVHVLLARLQVAPERLRSLLEPIPQAPADLRSREILFSDELKRALALAAEEAESLGSAKVGGDALLLGLMRIDGPAARALSACGMNVEGKQVVLDYVAAFNRGDIEALRRLFTPDALVYGVLGFGGLDVVVPIWRELHESFEIVLEVQSIVAEGNVVAVRYVERGRSARPFRGQPATGKAYELLAMEWFEIQEERIHRRWEARDSAAQLRQMGLPPG